MPYMNSVVVMGHLTDDPKLQFTQEGTAVTNFTVAINYGGRDGKKGRTDFIPADVWGGWAENLVKTAKKGALVLVQGYLFQERWIDAETNQNRSRLKVRGAKAVHLEAQYAGAGGGEPEVDPVVSGKPEEGCDPPGAQATSSSDVPF